MSPEITCHAIARPVVAAKGIAHPEKHTLDSAHCSAWCHFVTLSTSSVAPLPVPTSHTADPLTALPHGDPSQGAADRVCSPRYAEMQGLR